MNHRLLSFLVCCAATTAVCAASEQVDLSQLAPEAQKAAIKKLFTETTPVSLPAGQLCLADALKRMSTGQNANAESLGLDCARKADLKAFNGSYWDAALRLCTAYDMSPAGARSPADNSQTDDRHEPASTQNFRSWLRGGFLHLAPRPFPAHQFYVSGPILARVQALRSNEARRLSGNQRWVDFTLDLRFEPRCPIDLIHQASLKWMPSGELSINSIDKSDCLLKAVMRQQSRRPDLAPHGLAVRVQGLTPEQKTLSLKGTLSLECRLDHPFSKNIQTGDSHKLTCGTKSYTVELKGPKLKEPKADPHPDAQFLHIIGPDLITARLVEPTLTDSNGKAQNLTLMRQETKNGQPVIIYGVMGTLAAPFTVSFTRPVDLGTVEIPLAFSLQLP